MGLTIRKTKKSDAEQWIKLKNAVWRRAYVHIMPKEIFDEQDKSVNASVEKFEARTLNANGHVGFVAVDNGKIVALADATTLSFYDHYKEHGYADLGAIYIHPDYQHFGLGRKLFSKVTNEFVKFGRKKMVIGVLKDNFQARKAYEKWGGKLDATYEKPFIKFDKEYPEVFYLFDLI